MLEVNLFGEGAIFDHIGLAVKSIREVMGENSKIVADDTQRVSVAFIETHGIKLELIEMLGENSPITASQEKGQKLVHLCFRVPEIALAVEIGRKNGFHCIAKPVPAKAFENRKIAWLFSRTYGLIELLEN